MRSFLLFTLLFLFSISLLNAIENKTKVELSKDWPKATSVISNFTTVITFEKIKNSDSIHVVKYDTIKIIPLKNETFYRNYSFDNYSSLGRYSLKEDGIYRKRMNATIGSDQSSGIFHSDLIFKHLYFTPDVTSKYYTFTTKKTINEIRFFTTDFLNDYAYPIENRKYVIHIPDWLEIDIKDYNFKYFDIESKVSSLDNSKIKTYVGKKLVSNNSRKKDINFLSPFHSYPFLLFLPKSFKNTNGDNINIISDTKDLFNWYKGLLGDISYDEEFLKPIVNEITTNAKTPIDSIKSIYYWVQENIRYVAFENGLAGFRPDKADLVYKKKYGDCKGMSNLLYAMLNIAGFDAKLAWIGTKHLIFDYSTPSLAVDNHMICYLNYKSTDYFLDATNQNIALGTNSPFIQGKDVLINNGDDYLIKRVPIKQLNESISERVSNLTLKDELLMGSSQIVYSGDARIFLVSALSHIKQNDYSNFFKEVIIKDKNIQFDSVKINNMATRDSALVVSFNQKINNAVVKFDDEIYLSLNCFNSNLPEKVDTTNCFHFFMTRKINNKSTITIEIPENLSVKKLPGNVDFSNGIFHYQISYKLQDNKIICQKEFKIEKQIIYKDLFEDYITFIDSYYKSLNQAIELNQVSSTYPTTP